MKNKTFEYSHFKRTFLVGTMFCMVIFMLNLASSWSTTTFNNSLESENLTFFTDTNCNQEYANVSTSCGGLNSGNYLWGSSYCEGFAGFSLKSNFYDGNYSTGVSCDNNYVYINYTKPYQSSNAIWKISGWNVINKSINIPSNCWNYNTDKLLLKVTSASHLFGGSKSNGWLCHNSTGWQILSYQSSPSDSNFAKIYEESIYWQINKRYLSIPENIIVTNAYLNLSGNYSYDSSVVITDNTEDAVSYTQDSCTGCTLTNPTSSWDELEVTASDFESAHNTATNYWHFMENYTNPNPSEGWGNITGWTKYTANPCSQASCSNSIYIYVGCNPATDELVYSKTFTSVDGYQSKEVTYDFPKSFYNDNPFCVTTALFTVGSSTDTSIISHSENSINWYNKTYPKNPYIKIGNTNIWNYTGNFNQTNNKTSNLALTINNYLNSTYLVGDNYLIPFLFHSDTTGILKYSAMNFDDMGFIENSQTYNSTTYGSSYESFYLNLTYNPSEWNSISAVLMYNNTAYSSTSSGTGNERIFSKESLVVPTVSSEKNISFYWNVSLSNSTNTYYFTTDPLNQTVFPLYSIEITSGSCSAGLNKSLYFDFGDENTRDSIDKVNVSYLFSYGLAGDVNVETINGSLSNIKNFSVCINNSKDYYFLGYGEVDYSSASYSDNRFYLFTNTRLTNETISNRLFLLPSTDSTPFVITAQDNLLNLYSGYYLSVLRWYPSINEYKVVSMSKTDENGQSIFNVKEQDVDYRIGLYTTSGTLIKLGSPLRMICLLDPCEYSFYANPSSNDYTSYANIQSSFSYNNDTKVLSFTWNDPSQNTHEMNLLVTKSGGQTIICNVSGSSFTGILTCSLSGQTGTITATAKRSASPYTFFASKIVDLSTGLKDIAGGKSAALLISLILVTLLALIGVFSPFAAIILGVIGLFPAVILGGFPVVAWIGIGILGGIVVHFMRRT